MWDAISKPSRNRAYDITRAHLAAAVDWLDAANMKRAAAEQWWGKPPGEYARAHKWRERITGRTATDLTVFVFDQLKPPRRSQVSEAEAKAKAEELRKIASDRKTKA